MNEDLGIKEHLREHELLSDAHRREHDNLIREVAATAKALEDRVRETALALAKQFAETTATLEVRVKEVAELHWDNHRIEHESDQRAVDKVERNMVERFNSVNEFRDQQKDIITGFLPRKEYDGAHGALVDRVDQVRNVASTHISREEFIQALTARDVQIASLNTFRDQQGGVRQQSTEGKQDNRWMIGLALSVPGFLLGAIALVVLLTK